MKNIFRISLIALLMVVALASCKRNSIIPDKQLREIFKEVYLTNAYFQNERGNKVRQDSLDVYVPILQKYGYDIEDLKRTMANFSRRKSVRLSDVVNQAITELEDEESELRYRATISDTISMRAQRMFSDTLFFDSRIEVRRIADTSRLRIDIPVREGVIDVSYSYMIDSIDQNRGLKTTFTLFDRNGKQTNTQTNWMTSRRRQDYSTKLDATDKDSVMQIVFANYNSNNIKQPSLSIDSLVVIHYPQVDKALRMFDRQMLNYSIPFYDDYKGEQEISGPLYLYTVMLAQERDSDDRQPGDDS